MQNNAISVLFHIIFTNLCGLFANNSSSFFNIIKFIKRACVQPYKKEYGKRKIRKRRKGNEITKTWQKSGGTDETLCGGIVVRLHGSHQCGDISGSGSEG